MLNRTAGLVGCYSRMGADQASRGGRGNRMPLRLSDRCRVYCLTLDVPLRCAFSYVDVPLVDVTRTCWELCSLVPIKLDSLMGL